jgi:hypothetical protein
VVVLVLVSPSEVVLGLEDRWVMNCVGGICRLVGAVDGAGCQRWGEGVRTERVIRVHRRGRELHQ